MAAVHTLLSRWPYTLPDLSANLISISMFNDLGFYTTFGRRKVIFLDMTKKVMMEECHVGGMYLLNMGTSPTAPTLSGGTVAISACSHEKPVGIDTWHWRLGYAGISIIHEILRKRMVEGLSITGDMDTSILICGDLHLSNQLRVPFTLWFFLMVVLP